MIKFNSIKISNIVKIFVFSTIPILLIVLIYIFHNFSETTTHLSQSLINRTIKKTELQLNIFFNPIKQNIIITRDRGKSGIFKNLDKTKLKKIDNFLHLLSRIINLDM